MFVVEYCREKVCSDICTPWPGGFRCTCPRGIALAEDGVTCQTGSTYMYKHVLEFISVDLNKLTLEKLYKYSKSITAV